MVSKPSKATTQLQDRRREAEARLADLRTALDRELGWTPRNLWWLPVVGFACGVVLSGAVGRRKKRQGS